jgi:hypothetical protein
LNGKSESKVKILDFNCSWILEDTPNSLTKKCLLFYPGIRSQADCLFSPELDNGDLSKSVSQTEGVHDYYYSVVMCAGYFECYCPTWTVRFHSYMHNAEPLRWARQMSHFLKSSLRHPSLWNCPIYWRLDREYVSSVEVDF